MFPLRLICLMFLSGISGEDFLASSRFELQNWQSVQSLLWNSSSPPYDECIQVEQRFRIKFPPSFLEPIRQSVTVVPGPGISIPQPCFVSAVSQLAANWHRPQDWVPPPKIQLVCFLQKRVCFD